MCAHASVTNLLEVLALELGDDLLETVTLSVNADGGEDGLDVVGRGGLVASKGEEQVGGEVLHFERTGLKKKIFISIANSISDVIALLKPQNRLRGTKTRCRTYRW